MIEAGDRCPPFEVPDETGAVRTLKDLAGPRGLVLYFYPKDNTPGCTLEARDFRDLLPRFEALGYRVAGVSRDSQKSHCAFITKERLPFPLLSDADGRLSEAVGAWGEKVMYGRRSKGMIRSTLVLDPGGTVLRAYPKVSATGHAATVLAHLESQGR
ncbi:MAG: peroxiredoxin [Acidobacteriota bacterium]